MANIDARLRAIIEYEVPDGRRFKALQDATGIDANRWKAVWHGRQRVMPDMIEAIATKYPEHAFWMATGISDPNFGHIAPGNQGFPYRGEAQPSSSRYFREALAAKSAAEAAAAQWLKVDLDIDPDWGAGLRIDKVLRAAGQLDHARTPELQDCLRRTKFSAQLREAEIKLHADMPHLDYDETEAALKAVKRLLGRSLENAEARHMTVEIDAIQRQVKRLDEIIERHHSNEKMIADLKSTLSDRAK
ncbi:hypothetical protein AAHK20_25450 [Trinickia sp. YCB016]